MKYLILTIIALTLVGCANNHPVMVGDEKVVIKQYTSGKGRGKNYIHVHQNEQTALKAAKTMIHKDGGSLITLVHSGERNIAFQLHGKRYEFDPNRIFTDAGIKKTLIAYSSYSPDAHKEVKKLANQIELLLPKGKIIAVHNNKETYSLKEYLPGHSLAPDAKALHVAPLSYYRNFYLVTQFSDYLRLKTEGFNGVLQKHSATDDGSLSVLFAKGHYINVEAGYNQLAEQIKMLEYA
jgi:hypothetical protein